MDYTIEADVLTLRYYSAHMRSKVSRVVARAPAGIPEADMVRIAESMITLLTGLGWDSFKDTSHALAAIFRYFVVRNLSWPTAEEWPMAVFNLYCHELSGYTSTRTVDSSRETWNRMRRILGAFMKDRLIPECKMPSGNLPRSWRKELSETLVLGEAFEPVAPPSSENNEILPKQYLVDLGYVQESDAFFETIRAELEAVSKVTFELCWAYWEEVRVSHAIGRELIESVTREELMAAINHPDNDHWPRVKKPHPADPDSARGLAYFLAAVDYYFFEVGSVKAVSLEALRNIPFFKRIGRSSRLKTELFKELGKALKVSYVYGPDLIARGIGLLSSRDCSAIAAILIHEQPRFTPASLERAAAYDKKGKLHVNLTDAGGEHVFFTIAKHRAKARKGYDSPTWVTNQFTHIGNSL